MPVVYADAYFLLGDQRQSPGQLTDDPNIWNSRTSPSLPNGWGAILFLKVPGWPTAVTIRGEVPPEVLVRFCSRRAFIYFLEAWAQCVPLWAFGHLIQRPFATFCDNEAAKHALIKGYGRDEGINSLISMFWTASANLACDPWIERVSSKANISDGVSRNDFQLPRRHGWPHIHLDYEPLWPILMRAVDDIEFAVQDAPQLACEALQSQVRRATQHWHGPDNTKPSL